jgi:hypothetical protein
MKPLRIFPFALALSVAALMPPLGAADAPVKPLYHTDFEKVEEGKAAGDLKITAADGKPVSEFMVMSGEFVVKQDGKDGKFLELPGEPLDTFGLLFGPSPEGNATASARFFGTKKGRKFPAFAVSLGGAAGYRLQVSAAKKTLEIFQGDEARQSVAYEWTDASWTSLRIQIRKAGDGWVIEGKAWAAGTPEPAAWNITYETKEEPAAGKAGIWGNPFSGTPIRFDDLDVSPAR